MGRIPLEASTTVDVVELIDAHLERIKRVTAAKVVPDEAIGDAPVPATQE